MQSKNKTQKPKANAKTWTGNMEYEEVMMNIGGNTLTRGFRIDGERRGSEASVGGERQRGWRKELVWCVGGGEEGGDGEGEQDGERDKVRGGWGGGD